MPYENGNMIQNASGWLLEKLGMGMELVQEYGGKAWKIASDLGSRFMGWLRGDAAGAPATTYADDGYRAAPRRSMRQPRDILPQGFEGGAGIGGGEEVGPPTGYTGFRGGSRRGGGREELY